MRSRPALELLPPPELSDERAQWYRLPLTPEQVKLKMAGVRAYKSQEPWFDRLLLSFPRQDEIFEALMVREVAGGEVEWRDIRGHRRGLGGAEVRDLRLQLGSDLHVTAEMATTPRRIPQQGYICLDLRTWDDRLNPVITTLYVKPGGQAEAIRLEGEVYGRPLLTKASVTLGKVEVTRLPLPAQSLARKEMLVTCYGSVKDRQTEPAVIGRVRFGEGGKQGNHR